MGEPKRKPDATGDGKRDVLRNDRDLEPVSTDALQTAWAQWVAQGPQGPIEDEDDDSTSDPAW